MTSLAVVRTVCRISALEWISHSSVHDIAAFAVRKQISGVLLCDAYLNELIDRKTDELVELHLVAKPANGAPESSAL